MKKWIIFLAITYKLSLTNSLTLFAQDLNPRPYTLTENGAKLALKYKIDAESFAFQLTQKDSIIYQNNQYIKQQAAQIQTLQAADTFNQKSQKLLNKKLFWKTVEIWTWRITAAATAITVIIIKTKK